MKAKHFLIKCTFIVSIFTVSLLLAMLIFSTFFSSYKAGASQILQPTPTAIPPLNSSAPPSSSTNSVIKGTSTPKHPVIPASGPKVTGTPTVTVGHSNSSAPDSSTPSTERSGQDTVVFVHGITPKAIPLGVPGNFQPIEDSTATDCVGYWGDVLNYMNSDTHGALNWGRKDFRTVQFYNGDTNCSNGWDTSHSPDLHDSEYASHCTNYPNSDRSKDGDFREDLYHVSCLFAWYIYDNFGQNSGWNVELVGHSMGGLIIHNAIYQVQNRNQLGTGNTFLPTLGHISDVVTLNSPHQGHNLNWFYGTLCKLAPQCAQMDPQSGFTQEMNTALARNSQAGGTDWTLIGSECDPLVSASSATITWNVGHKIVYGVGGPACYNHGGALHDTQDLEDANQYWCDWQDQGSTACNGNYKSNGHYGLDGARSLYDMLNALWSDQW